MKKEDLINHLIENWINSLDFVSDDKFNCLKKVAIKYYDNDLTSLLELNNAIVNKKEQYISSLGDISYKTKDNKYYFNYENEVLEFSYDELKIIIRGFIDLLDKVYPIGTLVELKKEHMKKITQNKDVDKIEVVIVSRFNFSSEPKTYFNYAGVVYPIGLLSDSRTIQFTSNLIEKVVHEGYSDEKEDAYVYLMKKEFIIDKKMSSFAFSAGEENEKCKEIIGGNLND